MKRKSLSTQVAERLRHAILSGQLAPGVQLPTEAELCDTHEVSRTVIREAVAQLRSEGLVIPRQGKGVFVNDVPPAAFSVADPDLRALPQTIALLELRLAVEVESAGLAAQRRTDAEAAAIRAEMERIDAEQADPSLVRVHYDYDFHLLIARASRNAQIAGFLSWLRSVIGPRLALGTIVQPGQTAGYYDRIHGEHLAIVAAIESRNSDAARAAMREHLENSLTRLRVLASTTGQKALDPDATPLFSETAPS